MLIVILLLMIAGAGLSAYLLKEGFDVYSVDRISRPVERMRDDIIAGTPDYVLFSDISKDMVNSIVAIEDHRFFDRNGLDFISMARALYSTFVKEMPQGGSTITEQVAKNYYYSYQLTLQQKMAEIFFLYEMEANYSKEEILEMYLNIIYYGDGYYGIGQAARGYFGKDAKDLDLFEGSLLSGIINAPSIYNLSTGKELAIKRQKSVISCLKQYGYIDEAKMNELLEMGNQFALEE